VCSILACFGPHLALDPFSFIFGAHIWCASLFALHLLIILALDHIFGALFLHHLLFALLCIIYWALPLFALVLACCAHLWHASISSLLLFGGVVIIA